MICTILAVAADTIHDFLLRPNIWPGQANFLSWCRIMDPATAALLIVFGFIFLFSGFKLHRLLVGLTCAILGGYLGAGAAHQYGLMWVGLIAGAVILGVVGFYLTAWMAAMVGALCGAVVGASVWNAAGLNPAFAWSGALTGSVMFGLLSFIIFRLSVIIFTALQGSAMLLLGSMGMAYQYATLKPHLDDILVHRPIVLPIVLLGLAFFGMMFQHIKGPNGGGGGKSSGSSSENKPAKAAKADE